MQTRKRGNDWAGGMDLTECGEMIVLLDRAIVAEAESDGCDPIPHGCAYCDVSGYDPSTVHRDPCPMCKGSRWTLWEPWEGWRQLHARYSREIIDQVIRSPGIYGLIWERQEGEFDMNSKGEVFRIKTRSSSFAHIVHFRLERSRKLCPVNEVRPS